MRYTASLAGLVRQDDEFLIGGGVRRLALRRRADVFRYAAIFSTSTQRVNDQQHRHGAHNPHQAATENRALFSIVDTSCMLKNAQERTITINFCKHIAKLEAAGKTATNLHFLTKRLLAPVDQRGRPCQFECFLL